MTARSSGATTLLLLLAALMFGGFGVMLMLDPTWLDRWLEIRAGGAEGNTELRAFYGGMEIGLALFLVACATKPAWRGIGCVALTLLCGGTAAGRIYGFAVDHSFNAKLAAFLAIEVLFAVLPWVIGGRPKGPASPG